MSTLTFLPKNGTVFKSLIVCRGSGLNAKDANASQERKCRNCMDSEIGDVENDVCVMAFDHACSTPEDDNFLAAMKVIESGVYDLAIVSDLTRLSRDGRAMVFIEQCARAATRFIAIEECIDTLDMNWRGNSRIAHRDGDSCDDPPRM
jgi:hypothetical protein